MLVIEGSLLTFFLINGVIPDLLLIVVVCLAFLWGEKRGMVVGLFSGFLQDIFFGQALGFYTLAKMISAFLAALTSREIYRDQIIGPMFTVFLVTLVHELILFCLAGFFWGNKTGLLYAFEEMILPRAIYHFVLTLFFYPLLYRAEQKRFFYPSFK